MVFFYTEKSQNIDFSFKLKIISLQREKRMFFQLKYLNIKHISNVKSYR